MVAMLRPHRLGRVGLLVLALVIMGLLTTNRYFELPLLSQSLSGSVVTALVGICAACYPLLSVAPQLESTLVRERQLRIILLACSSGFAAIGWAPLMWASGGPPIPLVSPAGFCLLLGTGWLLVVAFGDIGLLIAATLDIVVLASTVLPDLPAARLLGAIPEGAAFAGLVGCGVAFSFWGTRESRARSAD